MIRASYDRTACSLQVEGHALGERNGEGNDLLCCSATILTYTLAAALIDLCADGHVSDPSAILRPGYALLACTPSHRSRPTVTVTFDTVARGFALLAGRYPENIVFEEK